MGLSFCKISKNMKQNGKFNLIAYSTSSRGESRLKQHNLSGNYCVEFNSSRVFGTLKEVWPEFKLTRGPEIRYIGPGI